MRPRLIKNLRRSLIGLIALVLLAIAVNYAHIWYQRARSVQKAAQILSSEVARSFNRIEYSEYQKGVLRFRISARRVLESRQGKSFLEGIEAYDFNPDGSLHNEIRSRKAEYDRESKVADFSGDVRLFLGTSIELRTESLHYDLHTNIGATEDEVRFHSKMASGSARGIHFDQNAERLSLNSNVDFELTVRKPGGDPSAAPERFRATANRAAYSDRINRMVFEGGARIRSESVLLTGESIEALLSPERGHVTSLTAAGNAVYESGDLSETQTLRGDRMVFGIGESQTLETINIVGNAAFSTESQAGTERLKSEEIDLVFDPATSLPSRIEGRRNVSFARNRGAETMQISGDALTAAFASGTKLLEHIHVQKRASVLADDIGSAMRNELRADSIRMEFRKSDERAVLGKLRAEGSARWLSTPIPGKTGSRQESERMMTASSLEMFYSPKGDSFESGSADGSVILSERRGTPAAQSETRRLLADHVQFRFFPGSNRLRDMDADGHVRLIQETQSDPGTGSAMDSFKTSSDRMRAVFLLDRNEHAIESLAQWGNFQYADSAMTAAAGRCEYDARAGKVVLRESPRIADAANSATGEWMEYEQKQDVVYVHGRVRSVLNTGKNSESFFASSSSSPAIVTADQMQYSKKDRRARYEGNVQLLSENGQLQAGKLDIVESGERIEAQDSVRHFIPERAASEGPAGADKAKEGSGAGKGDMVIQSSRLEYSRGSSRIGYRGSVTAHSGDIVMSSESLDVLIAGDGRSVEHATARGKVRIRQGARICKGDTADYFLNPQKFVLLGNPAEVNDPEKGRSYAGRLTSFIADDRILLENR